MIPGHKKPPGNGSNQYSKKEKTSEKEFFDNHVRELLARGEYLSCIRLQKDLSNIVTVKHIPQFNELERLNRLFDGVINTYLFISPICTYHELESELISAFKAYTKNIDPIETFESIGVGRLTAHPLVRSAFSFPPGLDPKTLRVLPFTNVMLFCFDFYSRHLNLFRGSIDELRWQAINCLAVEYVHQRFHCSGDVVGLTINFRSLLRTFRTLERTSSKEFEDVKSLLYKEGVKKLHEKILQVVASIGVNQSLSMDTLFKVIGNQPIRLFRILQNDFVTCSHGTYDDLRELLLMKYIGQQGDNNISMNLTEPMLRLTKAVSTIYFVVSQSNIAFAKAQNEINDIDQTIREFFGERIFVDIPDNLVAELFNLVCEQIIKNTIFSSVNDFNVIDNSFREYFMCESNISFDESESIANSQEKTKKQMKKGQKVQKKNKVSRKVSFDSARIDVLLAGVIVFYRHMCVNQRANEPFNIHQYLVSMKDRFVFQEHEPAKKLGKLIELFGEFETTAMNAAGVPAFQCLRLGTFNQYLVQNESHLIMAAADALGMSSANESHVYSTTKVVDVDRSVIIDEISNVLSGSSFEVDVGNPLDFLFELEVHVCDSFRVATFEELNQGSFIKFLVSLTEDNDTVSAEGIKQKFMSLFRVNRSPNDVDRNNNASQPNEEISINQDHFSLETVKRIIKLLMSSLDKCELAHTDERATIVSALKLLLGVNSFQDNVLTAIGSEMANNANNPRPILKHESLSLSSAGVKAALLQLPTSITADSNGAADRLVALISASPLGVGCRKTCLWSECYLAIVDESRQLKFLDFVVSKENLIVAKLTRGHLLLLPSFDDCVIVPTDEPSFDSFNMALEEELYSFIAAYSISAIEGVIDNQIVRSVLRACFRGFENLNENWLSKLFDITLNTTFSVARPFQDGVLRFIVDEIAKLQLISSTDIFVELLRYVKCNEFKSRRFYADMLYLASTSELFRKLWYKDLQIIEGSVSPFAGSQMPVTTVERLHDRLTVRNPRTDSLNNDILRDESTTIDGVPSAFVKESINASVDTACRDFVNQLLIREFDYSNDGKPPSEVTANAKKLQNALQHLSSKLYSNDVHFVMELLQNADDNTYPSTVVPTIKLKLYIDELVVFNNEIGFQDANIAAICSVGASTKAGKKGYIGQKGIGFKSVFAVSNQPEIHSNGFHIRFDRDRSMIEPIWIENISVNDGRHSSSWPAMIDNITGETFNTCLRLPFDKASIKIFNKRRKEIEDAFESGLILFLNKLERMILDDSCQGREIVHVKERLSDNWTRVSSTWTISNNGQHINSETFWFSKCLAFKPNMKRLSTDETISEYTEIWIAVKFKKSPGNDSDADDTGEENAESYCKLTIDKGEELLPLYAFLPTKVELFNFILQGDFALSSSREGILESDEWNLVLLSKVPALFREILSEMAEALNNDDQATMDILSDTNHLSIHQLRDSNYKVILRPEDLLRLLPKPHKNMKESDPFRVLISNIYSELSDLPFLPSCSGMLCAPKQLYVGQDVSYGKHHTNVVEIVDESFVYSITGRYLLHHDFEMDESIAALLKIPSFGADEALMCLEKMCTRENEVSIASSADDVMDNSLGDSSLTHARHVEGIVSLLLVIALEYYSANDRQSRTMSMTPAVIARNMNTHRPRSTMQTKVYERLKVLPIWLTTAKKFVSLSNGVIFVNSGEQRLREVTVFLPYLNHLMTQLDPSFVDQAKIIPDGQNILMDFILKNLKASPLRRSGLEGFEEMTCDTIIRSTILPMYKHPVSTDRVVSAVCIAFLFKCRATLKQMEFAELEKNVHIPVSTVKNSNSKIVWAAHGPQIVQNGRFVLQDMDRLDLHVGIEVADSATSILLQLPVVTGLQQMNWAVVDPIVAAFALDCGDKSDTSKPNVDNESAKLWFDKVDESKFQEWRRFLESISIIDMFSIEQVHQSSNDDIPMEDGFRCYHSSSLIQFLDHLTRNGKVIKTSQSSDPLSSNITVVDSSAMSSTELNDDLFKDNIEKLPSIPLWLKYPMDTAKLITDDLFKTLMTVVKLVSRQLHQYKLKIPSSKGLQYLIEQLQSKCWFPVWTSDEIKDAYVDMNERCGLQVAKKALYIITSPRNAVVQIDNNNGVFEGEYLIGLHGLHVPSKLFEPLPNDSKGLQTSAKSRHHSHYQNSYSYYNSGGHRQSSVHSNDVILGLYDFVFVKCTGSYGWIEDSDVASLVKWMSSQRHSLICPKSFLVRLYERIKDLIIKRDQAMIDMVLGNEPLIWFPRLLPDVDSHAIEDPIVGDMYRLSQIIEKDDTRKIRALRSRFTAKIQEESKLTDILDLDGLIRVISDDYNQNLQSLLSEYGRDKICNRCRAVEGMFGSRGQPQLPPSRCQCKHSSISEIFSLDVGLLKKSPGIEDMLTLVKYFANEIRSIDPESQGDLQSETLSIIPKHLSQTHRAREMGWLKALKSVLESIGRDIWKCFELQNCLHPYSPAALRVALTVFTEQSIIPLYRADVLQDSVSESIDFIDLKSIRPLGEQDSKQALAVDDLNLFKDFASNCNLENIEMTQWIFIDSVPTERDTDFTYFLDVNGAKAAYDIDDYDKREVAFQNLPDEVFSSHAYNIPGETFFAPMSMNPLMKFLGIDLLSDCIESRIECSSPCVSDDSLFMEELINSLLYVIQTKLVNEESFSYSQLLSYVSGDRSSHLSSILNEFRVEIFESINCLREVHFSSNSGKLLLSRSSQDPSKSSTCSKQLNWTTEGIKYSFDKNTRKLQLKKGLVKTDRVLAFDIARNIVMSALRLDIAILFKNQHSEVIENIQSLLKKISRLDLWTFDRIEESLRYEQLERRPEPNRVWKIPSQLTVESHLVQEINQDELESLLEGYSRLKARGTETAKKRKQSSIKAMTEVDKQRLAEEEQYRAELHERLQDVSVEKSDYPPIIDPHAEQRSRIVPDERVPSETPMTATEDRYLNMTALPPNPKPAHKSSTINPVNYRDGGMSDPLSGRYVPGLQNNRSNDILTLVLSGDYLSQNVYQILVGDSVVDPREGDDLVPVSASETAPSGRVGECLVYRKLQELMPNSTVTWVNSEAESGLAYDVVIASSDQAERFCEVKTRVAVPDRRIRQWFVSMKEVLFANQLASRYFCVFVEIDRSEQSGSTLHMVGLENGFAAALESKEANLIVQIS